MKLQLSLIIMMILCVMETISSTSKDDVLVGNKNTQNTDKVMLDLNKNENQYEQGFQDQQSSLKKKNHKSNFTGVSWNNNKKKWQGQFKHKKKRYYGGLFDHEEQAAMNVNLLCDKYEVKRKNPTINIKHFTIQQKNQTSKFSGVFWKTNKKKWHAEFIHNKKLYYGGNFDNEEQAAMKVNLLCDKCEIKRKNPRINIKSDAIQQKNKTSIYNGVSWNNANKKWEVKLMHNKKRYTGGHFDNEEQAAMKVNLLCDKLEIERKNPTINIKSNTIQQKSQTSKFTGVSWHIDSKKWQSKLMHNKNYYYGGKFDNEEQAAMNVNLLCDKLEMERKNPTINIKSNTIEQKNKTSIFNGVCWNTKKHKWQAELKYKRKNYYGGQFDNEEQAAMKVNLLCDKCEIERKNPTINIKSKTIQQMIMCQSQPEYIVNEDIKVEEENVLDEFKDESKNRFIKNNDDILPQNYANEKRKRKKHSIENDDVMKEKLGNYYS